MILPFLKGILRFRRVPGTYILLAVNFLIFALTLPGLEDRQKKVVAIFSDEFFVRSQGLIFAQFIHRYSDKYSAVHQTLSMNALKGDHRSQNTLGVMATRDILFLAKSETEKFTGDDVSRDYWQKRFRNWTSIQGKDLFEGLGLGFKSHEIWNFFTYQFTHAGFLHLLSNMWFLLIFGAFIELWVGMWGLFLIYLICGIFAGAGHVLLAPLMMTPLVGASGSVSGLMAFFAIRKWRSKIRFLYWVLPFRGYFGFVWLPTWVAVLMWFGGDLVGYLGQADGAGSVAHTAHLGGFLTGGILALTLFSRRRKTTSKSVFAHTPRFHELK